MLQCSLRVNKKNEEGKYYKHINNLLLNHIIHLYGVDYNIESRLIQKKKFKYSNFFCILTLKGNKTNNYK